MYTAMISSYYLYTAPENPSLTLLRTNGLPELCDLVAIVARSLFLMQPEPAYQCQRGNLKQLPRST